MANFSVNKSVEADQFVVSDEQQKEFKEKKIVIHQEGAAQLKKDNEGFFAVVSIKGEATIVRDGDYLVKEDGKIVSVVSKAQFEAEHQSA